MKIVTYSRFLLESSVMTQEKKTATDDVDLQFGVTGLLKLTAHQQHKLGR